MHSQSCLTLCNTMGSPGSSAHGMFQQECWSGLPFPSLGDRSDSGIEPVSPVSSALAGGVLTIEPPGKPVITLSAPFSSVSQSCPTLSNPLNPIVNDNFFWCK